MASLTTRDVPASSTMALPHGPSGVGEARRRLRAELRGCGAPETVVDDAVLVLSELLGNACRYGRPLPGGGRVPGIRAGWCVDEDGLLTLEVTDGGGPTRPKEAVPSLTARGGRGLGIVGMLTLDWGVRDEPGALTVWAVLAVRARHARRTAAVLPARVPAPAGAHTASPRYVAVFDELD